MSDEMSFKAIEKKISKSKKEIDDIDKREQREFEKQQRQVEKDEKKLQSELKPAWNALFDILNDYFPKVRIEPFSNDEQKEMFDIVITKAFGGETPQFLEQIKTRAIDIRIAVFLIKAILPRLISFGFYLSKRQKRLKGEVESYIKNPK